MIPDDWSAEEQLIDWHKLRVIWERGYRFEAGFHCFMILQAVAAWVAFHYWCLETFPTQILCSYMFASNVHGLGRVKIDRGRMRVMWHAHEARILTGQR